jgi:hypothetical protein
LGVGDQLPVDGIRDPPLQAAHRLLHIAAVTQIRLDTEGRAYYRRKIADGKKPMERPSDQHGPGSRASAWPAIEQRNRALAARRNAERLRVSTLNGVHDLSPWTYNDLAASMAAT